MEPATFPNFKLYTQLSRPKIARKRNEIQTCEIQSLALRHACDDTPQMLQIHDSTRGFSRTKVRVVFENDKSMVAKQPSFYISNDTSVKGL